MVPSPSIVHAGNHFQPISWLSNQIYIHAKSNVHEARLIMHISKFAANFCCFYYCTLYRSAPLLLRNTSKNYKYSVSMPVCKHVQYYTTSIIFWIWCTAEIYVQNHGSCLYSCQSTLDTLGTGSFLCSPDHACMHAYI